MTERRDVDQLHEELQELFSDLWHIPRLHGLRRGFRPHVDTFRTEDPAEFRVVADLAGVDPDTVDVVVDERSLLLTGERRRQVPHCRLTYHQMEIDYGPFRRRLLLPEDVDPSSAQATYERGLLTIVLPVVAKPAPPEKISIPVRKSS